MCYNHAGKQKKNWLMRGAVAILTHKARPQNIPWLWRGKVQTCFSWHWGVYSLSWSPFATQTSGPATHGGLTFENMVQNALGDVLTTHYQAINTTTVPFIALWAGRSHGKMWLETIAPLSLNPRGSVEISSQGKDRPPARWTHSC